METAQQASRGDATTQHLVHVAAERVEQWRAEVGAQTPWTSAGAFYLARWPQPLPAAQVSAHPLCRYALPIEAAWPVSPRKRLDLDAAARALAEAAQGAPRARVAAVHPAMGRAAAALEARAQALLGAPPPDDDPAAPALVAALHADWLWAGRVSPKDAGAWSPCAAAPLAWLRLEPSPWISRAAVKWLEAREHLRRNGVDPDLPRRWLELGAAPGGMTEGLLATHPDAAVVAVDVAPMHPRLAEHPRLEAVRGDVASFQPPLSARFDGLVCDVNGPPHVALDATCRLIDAHLTPGGALMFTLKLPRWEAWRARCDEATARFAALGVRVEARHLVANRQELTLVGAKAPPP